MAMQGMLVLNKTNNRYLSTTVIMKWRVGSVHHHHNQQQPRYNHDATTNNFIRNQQDKKQSSLLRSNQQELPPVFNINFGLIDTVE